MIRDYWLNKIYRIYIVKLIIGDDLYNLYNIIVVYKLIFFVVGYFEIEVFVIRKL